MTNFDLVKKLILFPLFFSFLFSFITTPLVIFIYQKLGWVEKPHRPKDTHTYPVPRGGGIPILISLIFTSIISFLKINTGGELLEA